jgi:hypothetical protein
MRPSVLTAFVLVEPEARAVRLAVLTLAQEKGFVALGNFNQSRTIRDSLKFLGGNEGNQHYV